MSTRWKGKRYFVVDTQGQRVSSYFRDEDEAIGEMHRLAGLSDEVPFRVVAERRVVSNRKQAYFYNKVGDTGSTVTVNFTGPSTEQELRYILREDFGVHRPELITQDGPSTWQVDFPSSKWTGKKKRAAALPPTIQVDFWGTGTLSDYQRDTYGFANGPSGQMRWVEVHPERSDAEALAGMYLADVEGKEAEVQVARIPELDAWGLFIEDWRYS